MSGFFFFNDTATTEIYTLSLHDALPISFTLYVGCLPQHGLPNGAVSAPGIRTSKPRAAEAECAHLTAVPPGRPRSEEHTSELQSRQYLVCRLLLEKKKKLIDIRLPSIPT